MAVSLLAVAVWQLTATAKQPAVDTSIHYIRMPTSDIHTTFKTSRRYAATAMRNAIDTEKVHCTVVHTEHEEHEAFK